MHHLSRWKHEDGGTLRTEWHTAVMVFFAGIAIIFLSIWAGTVAIIVGLFLVFLSIFMWIVGK